MAKSSSSHNESGKKHPTHGSSKSGGSKSGGGKAGGGKAGAPDPPSPQPVFAQPTPSPDPTSFKNPVTDQSFAELTNLEPVPTPTGGAVEPLLTLAEIYGSAGAAKSAAIQASGQIVFHAVGDTGSVEGPSTQSLVADKMVSDFTEATEADVPSFFYHLGDVVYYFGEATYYYRKYVLYAKVPSDVAHGNSYISFRYRTGKVRSWMGCLSTSGEY